MGQRDTHGTVGIGQGLEITGPGSRRPTRESQPAGADRNSERAEDEASRGRREEAWAHEGVTHGASKEEFALRADDRGP